MNADFALIFDFDSTLVTVETLDSLASIALANAPDREERVAKIEAITSQGMRGELGFGESLSRRFAELPITATHVLSVNQLLINSISPSFQQHADWLAQRRDNVWIISGGFVECIVPVAERLGLDTKHILANTLLWSQDGSHVIGYDTSSPLAQDEGKIVAVRGLDLDPNRTIMIGDGMTDYSVRGAGLASEFIAYTETARRDEVVSKADAAASNADELVNHLSHLVK